MDVSQIKQRFMVDKKIDQIKIDDSYNVRTNERIFFRCERYQLRAATERATVKIMSGMLVLLLADRIHTRTPHTDNSIA